jgi:hypothetical protein
MLSGIGDTPIELYITPSEKSGWLIVFARERSSDGKSCHLQLLAMRHYSLAHLIQIESDRYGRLELLHLDRCVHRKPEQLA